MNQYLVTMWDPDLRTVDRKAGTGTVGGYVYLNLVAADERQALKYAMSQRGEITSFKLQASGLVVL